ncbi:MAG TPA: hypothetical protein VNK25_05040 [Candidatus Nitrosotenuis sp.]|jgi:hypothetical protein|nr:hypothetical protein [Candidatus Nitrosotenuis sp.]
MQLDVHVNDVKGTQMAAKITGTFSVDGHTFKFSAIAFGRIGGHNIGAKISKSTERELKKLGYDVNVVIDALQKNLVEGNITLPEGINKETFADG